MNDQHRASAARCGVVWLVSTGAVLALGVLLAPDLVATAQAVTSGRLADHTFPELLAWLCAAGAGCVATWWWAVTTVVTARTAAGRSTDRLRGVPAPVQRLLLAACGVALAGGLAAPAGATPGTLHQDRTGAATAALLTGLPLPDRATGALPGGARTTPDVDPEPARPGGTWTVRAGDNLWSVAERTLPAGASAPEVAARCQRIYALNQGVVGVDPDLVRPGQRLRLP
jgi:hypothetical protein